MTVESGNRLRLRRLSSMKLKNSIASEKLDTKEQKKTDGATDS
jgi:hypothetical protein